MDTDAVVWIVVALLVALVILGLLVVLSRRRTERRRVRAGELRDDAASRTSAIEEADVRAREAQVEADRARYQAELAQERAYEAKHARTQEEAQQEDRLREADRLDPGVDTSSDDYRPQRPEGGAHRAT